MPIKLRSISVSLPWGIGSLSMDVSDTEVRAAWALYVEFATRVSAQQLHADNGSVKEALDSLYSLFASTRDVLRAAGPDVARGSKAVGPLAIRALNDGLRPFLASWHTELEALPAGGGLKADRRAAFDKELAVLRGELAEYLVALAEMAGVRSE
jgi:hypothetical protein